MTFATVVFGRSSSVREMKEDPSEPSLQGKASNRYQAEADSAGRQLCQEDALGVRGPGDPIQSITR
jgi:hypothetical protein